MDRLIFRRLKQIQLALRVVTAAMIVAVATIALWVCDAFDHPGASYFWVTALLFACVVIALGAVCYLTQSCCPNCNSAFSWNWVRSDILKDDKQGRCESCGIRINVSEL